MERLGRPHRPYLSGYIFMYLAAIIISLSHSINTPSLQLAHSTRSASLAFTSGMQAYKRCVWFPCLPRGRVQKAIGDFQGGTAESMYGRSGASSRGANSRRWRAVAAARVEGIQMSVENEI